jgi:hypothetical protein
MSGSHLFIPRNQAVQPRYFQNRIIVFCLPILSLVYLWEIYIFPGSVYLFCCSQICGPILGIYRHMNVGIGTEAEQFLFRESINVIFGTVQRDLESKGWNKRKSSDLDMNIRNIFSAFNKLFEQSIRRVFSTLFLWDGWFKEYCTFEYCTLISTKQNNSNRL